MTAARGARWSEVVGARVQRQVEGVSFVNVQHGVAHTGRYEAHEVVLGVLDYGGQRGTFCVPSWVGGLGVVLVAAAHQVGVGVGVKEVADGLRVR